MDPETPFEEEAFGVLSSDEIYLDCILVKPKNLKDEAIEALYIWVPRYPLTKTSLINCARQEIKAEWRQGKTAHLVFDLRGTGDSDGPRGDKNFNRDITGLQLWAAERFGQIDIAILGQPDGHGNAAIFPIRSGVIVEHYHYRATATYPFKSQEKRPLLYLSTPGNFSQIDDELCLRLAKAGHEVFGLDPLRYLLHASSSDRLDPADLWADIEILCDLLPGSPVIIGQPLASGLAMLWACGTEKIAGVIAIGAAQALFDAWHIFNNDNPRAFFINRFLYRIAPRPIIFVHIEDHESGGDPKEIAAYYASVSHPRLAQKTKEVSPRLLLKLLSWIENEIGVDES